MSNIISWINKNPVNSTEQTKCRTHKFYMQIFVFQTAAWGSALSSFAALCSTPVSNIMSVPPGSSFDVDAYIRRLCSVDINQLSAELTQYQGFGRLEKIVSNYCSIYVGLILESSFIDSVVNKV